MKSYHLFKEAIKLNSKTDFLRLCSNVLSADKVSLWTIKDDLIFCESMYVKYKDEFTGGFSVKKKDCSELIKLMEYEDYILGDLGNKVIRDCLGNYLKLEDTKSILIVPISLDNSLYGFILYERKDKSWEERDVELALYLSLYLVCLMRLRKEIHNKKLYETLSAVRQVILIAKSKEQVFKEMCRALIDILGLKMVWIGIIDASGNLKPEYSCGDVGNYLEEISINIHDETSIKDPSIKAIWERKIQINNDTEREPIVETYRAKMLEMGYLSSCACPIILKGKIIGTINLYSGEKNFFTDEIIKLVEETGKDLSRALEYIESLNELKMFSRLIEQSHEWILITDSKGNITYANPAVEKLSGYSREEIIGKNPRIFKSGLHNREFYKKLWSTITSDKKFRSIFADRRKDGSIFYIDSVISPLFDEEGKITHFLQTATDITQLKELVEDIQKLLNYDTLTGLPNRSYFLKRLKSVLEEEKPKMLVVMLVDIDNLTGINAMHGYSFGDNILKAFGENLSKLAFCGRYGGDEFILFKELEHLEEIYELVSQVLAAGELTLNGNTYNLGLHIGISVYPTDGKTAEELIEHSEIALNRAKRGFPGTYEFYNPKDLEEITKKTRVVEELRFALSREEFILYFQSIFSPQLKIAGAEALLRWDSKSCGFLQAKDFIPILEETGLIREVGLYVFEKCAEIMEENHINVPIYVNLSPAQIEQKNLVEKLCRILERYNIPKKLIVIEITEEIFAKDVERVKATLKELKDCGFSIAIDDFGVKYSNLSYLANFPVDKIKIDIFLTRLVDVDEKVKKIVNGIIYLARSLDIETIAEGIERESQLQLLKGMGCDYLQGFYLSKPLPLVSFIHMLSKG